MELGINVNKRKKILYKFSIVFLAVLFLLIYFSKTINNFLLPKVTAVEYKKGTIGRSFEYEGIITYQHKNNILSKGNWIIKAVYVDVNQEVKKGDVLAQVEDSNIKIEEKRKTLEILQIENEVEILKKMQSVDKSLIKQRELELEIKRMEYEKIRNGLTEDGKILSDIDGKVVAINLVPGMSTLPNQIIFELVDTKPNYNVVWKLDSDRAMKLSTGSKVNIVTESKIGLSNNKNHDNETKGKGAPMQRISLESKIAKRQYQSSSDSYRFEVNIDNKDINVEEGQRANVSIINESPLYSCILPKNCLTEEANKNYIFIVRQREGILGIESFIEKIEVILLDSDDYNVAIEGHIREEDKIVINASKPLMDGMQIRLR